MNSILAAQKLRRGNSVGGKSATNVTATGDHHQHSSHHNRHPQPPAKSDHLEAAMTFEEPASSAAAHQQQQSQLPPSGREEKEGIEDFLDSIRQSIGVQQQLLQGPQKTTTPSINCWKPLDCNSETAVGAGFERRKPSFDCVSHCWNQNGAPEFFEDGGPSSFEQSSTVAANSNGNKSFRQYLDEQVLHQSEISLIAELFAQSQQQQSSAFPTNPSASFHAPHLPLVGGGGNQHEGIAFDQPLLDLSTTTATVPTRRISLANHEAESSAFQELPPPPLLLPPARTFSEYHRLTRPSAGELQDPAASISLSGGQTTTTSSSAASTSSTYFQPIDCPAATAVVSEGSEEVLTDPTASDWWALFGAQKSLAVTAATTTTTSSLTMATTTTTAMNKSVRALRGAPSTTATTTTTATSATSASSSAAASRSISVSRAELETYFTPTTELSSSNDGEEEPTTTTAQSLRTPTTTATMATAEFYPSLPKVLLGESTTTIISAQRRRRSSSSQAATVDESSLLLTAVEKLSNSACACKSACGGHFVESACCCVPDEYHCRTHGGNGNGDLSPTSLSAVAADMMRMW